MKKIFLTTCFILSSFSAMADSKLSVDLTIDSLKFQRPSQGVGKAGTLIFKNANVNNNGIILNLNNVNTFFDSQIFIRPTFLGFTTKFGNYGFAIEKKSILNEITTLKLDNSKLIMDDNQLNLAGENLVFVDPKTNIELSKFRLYCQNPVPPQTDLMKNCLQDLTLNGSYTTDNELAFMNYKSADKLTGETSKVEAKIKNIELKKNYMAFNLANIKSISNDYYIINANGVNVKCAKDPELGEFNSDKMIKDCLNQAKIGPFKAAINDQKAKTAFNIDMKDFTIKDKIVYATINSAVLSDTKSSTFLNSLLINCKKDTETDLLDLMSVINDCIDYGRLSILEVRSSKPDEKGDSSSLSTIAVNTNGGNLLVEANVKILGYNARVSIGGTVELDSAKKHLILTVTNTKLPLGLTSVKVLMYFLKKNLISKDISYSNNEITIAL